MADNLSILPPMVMIELAKLPNYYECHAPTVAGVMKELKRHRSVFEGIAIQLGSLPSGHRYFQHSVLARASDMLAIPTTANTQTHLFLPNCSHISELFLYVVTFVPKALMIWGGKSSQEG